LSKTLDKFNTTSLYDFVNTIYKQRNPTIQVKLDKVKMDKIIGTVNNHTYSDGGTNFFPSAFKKMAYFTALFVGKNISPGFLPSNNFIFEDADTMKYRKNNNFSSSYLAFMFSIWCLKGSTIVSKKASIDNEIHLSRHSLLSIVHTFSSSKSVENPSIVKDIYALLYEQIVYKTNPTLQYDTDITL
jgi:hypothetical protein